MMCIPLASANRAKAIHIEIVHRSGEEDNGGGVRCVSLGSMRDVEGSGDGDRRGCDVV